MICVRCAVAAGVVASSAAFGQGGNDARSLSAGQPSVNAAAAGPFVAAPYLQLGDAPALAGRDSVVIRWRRSPSEIEYRAKHQLHIMQHHLRCGFDKSGASNAPINALDLLHHHETGCFGAGQPHTRPEGPVGPRDRARDQQARVKVNSRFVRIRAGRFFACSRPAWGSKLIQARSPRSGRLYRYFGGTRSPDPTAPILVARAGALGLAWAQRRRAPWRAARGRVATPRWPTFRSSTPIFICTT